LNTGGLEIEHKYLIEYPDRELLLAAEGARSAVIEQTYLTSDAGVTERVREWKEDGQTKYFHTVKRRISDLTHLEDETEITEDEYLLLRERKREDCSPVRKERIMIPFRGHTVEVDIYPFWNDRAVAEVEIAAEDEEVSLPDLIRVIREVTSDRRYKNVSLAYDHDFPV
jgi:CYTH domain-containing protein